jgi:hypothetical protein
MTKLKKTRIRFDRKSAVATTIGAALALGPTVNSGATVRNERIIVQKDADALEDLAPVTEVTNRATASAFIMRTSSPDQEWTEELQKQFKGLAIKEALEEISSEEANQLEQLTVMRRSYQNPRTADEVLWEYEQRQVTEHLLETLQKYVQFYEGPSQAWRSAKKNPDRQ